jgi:hypothetical protein
VPLDDHAQLASAKKKMLEARNRRVRPHLDDKVLSSWNGLMLGAFARAYAVLGDASYRVAAEKNLAFIQAKLWMPMQGGAGCPEPAAGRRGEDTAPHQAGALFHRWRDGERDDVQLLEGHSFLLSGVIDLYEATLEPAHLDFAIALAESLLVNFFDPEDGGFWQTVADVQHLLLRVKGDYDGAEPSGNSVAALALLKLGAITGRNDFTEAAEKSLRFFAVRLHDSPQALPHMLQALDFSLQEPKRVVIAGEAGSAETRELLRAIHSVFQPNKVVLGNTGAVDDFARTLPAKNGPVGRMCAPEPPARRRPTPSKPSKPCCVKAAPVFAFFSPTPLDVLTGPCCAGNSFLQNRPQHFPDILGHNSVALGGRMDTVFLVQFTVAPHPFQQEGDQWRVISLRQFEKEFLESGTVFLAHVGRHLHAGDDDGSLRIGSFYAVDDRLQIRPGG